MYYVHEKDGFNLKYDVTISWYIYIGGGGITDDHIAIQYGTVYMYMEMV